MTFQIRVQCCRYYWPDISKPGPWVMFPVAGEKANLPGPKKKVASSFLRRMLRALKRKCKAMQLWFTFQIHIMKKKHGKPLGNLPNLVPQLGNTVGNTSCRCPKSVSLSKMTWKRSFRRIPSSSAARNDRSRSISFRHILKSLSSQYSFQMNKIMPIKFAP